VEQEREPTFPEIEACLKKATATLREAGIPFLLGGSLAIWARGGPETRNDLDLMVRPSDGERALEALVAAGMRPERPPEEWLLKAWCGDVLIDLIFRPSGLEVTDQVIERGDELSVLAINVRVMAVDDVLVTKLLSISEHSLDFESVMQVARALREQIDWETVRARTEGNPFARAFFVMAEDLGIAPPPGQAAEDRAGRTEVSVVAPFSRTGSG
jgi:hypothetical protein